MKHIPLDINDEQRGNLLYLAEYLDTGVTEWPFDMAHYQVTHGDGTTSFEEAGTAVCGTTACAAGHGPLIGIRFLRQEHLAYSRGEPGLAWDMYVHRAFTNYQNGLWEFLFSTGWQYVDNTPRGAAARIFYALEHGIPCKNPWDNRYRDYLWWAQFYTVKPQPRYTIEDLMPKVRARLEENA